MVLILLIRRERGELAALLGLTCVVLVLTAALSLFKPVGEYLRRLQALCGLETPVLAPLFKTIAIGILCQVTEAVCLDGGEQALARAVALCGTIGALYVSLPLIQAVFSLFEKLLQGG